MAGEEKDEHIMAAAGDESRQSGDANSTPSADGSSNNVVADTPPLLVFLNGASGGRMGSSVMRELAKLIPEAHIFNLDEVKRQKWIPEEKLKLFQDTEGVKVLICGGDGTMGWILSCIDRLTCAPEAFPVAMMPLGTGNDLARSYGWGPGFKRSMLKPNFLQRVRDANSTKLDRWLLSVMPYQPLGDDSRIRETHLPPTFSVHKYASAIGTPSVAAHDYGPLGGASEARSQSVLRMGRSFSVRMSSIAKFVHEDEMNRSSSHGANLRAALDGSDELSRSARSEGPIVIDNLGGSFSGRVSLPGPTTKTIATGLSRAVSAPPVMRTSSHSRRRSGGGGGAGQMSPGLPTVGESLLSPVSDVSGSASVYMAEYEGGAGEAGAAGAAAMIVSDDEDEKKEEEEDQPGETAPPTTAAAAERSLPTAQSARVRQQSLPPVPDGKDAVAAAPGTTVCTVPEALPPGSVVVTTDAEGTDGESNSEDGVRHKDTGSCESVGERFHETRRSKEVAVQTEAMLKAGGDGEDENNAIVQYHGPPRAMPSIRVIQRFEEWESYDAVFCNYYSFGVDAVAANAFHEHREKNPQLFTSRCRNQLWYARKGFPAAGGVPCASTAPPPLISKYLDLRIRPEEGGKWEKVDLDPSYRGVVVLNLQSYGGGRNLWGTAESGCSSRPFAKAAPDDKMLEIVGISNVFKLGCIMAFNKMGARAHRLCQAAEVEMRVTLPIHMQVDGEPWLQAPAKINIQHYGQSTCLNGNG